MIANELKFVVCPPFPLDFCRGAGNGVVLEAAAVRAGWLRGVGIHR